MSLLNYNPFEPLSEDVLKRIISLGNKYFVVQRFQWPGLSPSNTFVATPYADKDDAVRHTSDLQEKEGKLLIVPEEILKITSLINSDAYFIFVNTFRDQSWATRIIKAYNKNIVSYIRARTNFKAKDPIDIELKFENGRLLAVISSGDTQHLTSAYELIK
jgi:hypothetical protein